MFSYDISILITPFWYVAYNVRVVQNRKKNIRLVANGEESHKIMETTTIQSNYK